MREFCIKISGKLEQCIKYLQNKGFVISRRNIDYMKYNFSGHDIMNYQLVVLEGKLIF